MRRITYTGLLILLLSACVSRPYQNVELDTAAFLQRSQSQQADSLKVTVAVPDAAETETLTNLELYDQGIQPIWLKIENNGDLPARVAIWSIDRDYFSPIEVAYRNRKKFSSDSYDTMQRWFHENGLVRHVPAGESRTGLVFTHLKPGTKGFNLDIFRNKQATSFTFFVPIPGFTADYMGVDFATLYAEDEIQYIDQATLKTMLEQKLPCCTNNETSELMGGPLNTVLVGSTLTVRRSLLRGGWLETSENDSTTRYARQHTFQGRSPDGIFYIDREDGNERIQMSLWLTPMKVDSEPVWMGQVFYRGADSKMLSAVRHVEQNHHSDLLHKFVGENVMADMDGAQRFMMQNLWYNQSLRKVGLVTGVGESTPEQPVITFDGVGYFSRGHRAVLFLSDTPVALDDTKIIYTKLQSLIPMENKGV